MAGSFSYRVEQPSNADPAVVYDVLMDVERWPDFMPTVSAAAWERCGAPDTGEGGIRRLRMGVLTVREQIIGGTRPHRQTYTMLSNSGLPVIGDYTAEIYIDARPNGCLIARRQLLHRVSRAWENRFSSCCVPWSHGQRRHWHDKRRAEAQTGPNRSRRDRATYARKARLAEQRFWYSGATVCWKRFGPGIGVPRSTYDVVRAEATAKRCHSPGTPLSA